MRFIADTTISVGMDRYTYEPGVSFDLQYQGPVLYYVDQGKLALNDVDGLVLTSTLEEGDLSPGPMPLTEGDRYIFLPGQSVFAADGRLGPTQNADDEPLVVMALLIVENPAVITWGVTGNPNATPMKEFEIGSSLATR